MSNVGYMVLLVSALSQHGGTQETIVLSPRWRVGETDSYRFSMTMGTDRGDLAVTMRLNRSVKEVFANGDSLLESTSSETRIFFNGQEVEGSSIAKSLNSSDRVNRFGLPVASKGASDRGAGMGYFKFMTILADRGLAVGETATVEYRDPENPKATVKGTVKLVAIENGIAQLVSHFEITSENSASPMKAALTGWVRVSDSKFVKSIGTFTNVQAPQGLTLDAVQVSIERIESKALSTFSLEGKGN